MCTKALFHAVVVTTKTNDMLYTRYSNAILIGARQTLRIDVGWCSSHSNLVHCIIVPVNTVTCIIVPVNTF